MQSKWLSAAFAAAFILSMPWSAQAFECPKHIEAAEDAIDAANDSMIGLKSDLHMKRGHMLLDDAKMLLAAWEIPITPESQVTDRAAAVSAASSIGYPVALKLDSPDLLHKTEIGAVRLNLAGPDDVREA